MPSPHSPGPKTSQGKAIAARNATSHGLFARDIVLPHLGEDPAGYEALLAELSAQIGPANLLERHYTEKIAAASWRLRRLHRWQAQLFENVALSEDDILAQLDRAMRHETALHRQIDTAIKMLGRDVPHLFDARARETALSLVQATERDCARDPDTDWDVARTAREKRTFPPLPPDFDPATLDNTHAPADETQICENEPPEPATEEVPDVSTVHPDGRPVYLEPAVWRTILYCREHGEDAQADDFDRYHRQWYIQYRMRAGREGDCTADDAVA